MRALFVLTVCSLVALGAAQQPQPLSVPKQMLDSIGEFGQALAKKLHKNGDNLLVSPLSVHKALGMALLGADGETQKEMLQTMALNNIVDLAKVKEAYHKLAKNIYDNAGINAAQLRVNVANRMYLSKQFPADESYVGDVKKTLHADAVNVDFATKAREVKDEINNFVKNNTKGLIPQVLRQALPSNTVMALINTLYFNGTWVDRFGDLDESEQRVWNEGCAQEKQHNKWMRKAKIYPYIDSTTLDAQMVLLPYKAGLEGADASMLVILPHEEHKCNTKEWLNKFSWKQISDELVKLTNTGVELTMPRFEMGSRFKLEDVLPNMGMQRAFSYGDAEFSKMLQDTTQKLKISEVIHETKMIVTRHGTEAAAATAVSVTRLASGTVFLEPPKKLDVNRSFYMAILYHPDGQHKVATPLFTGVLHQL